MSRTYVGFDTYLVGLRMVKLGSQSIVEPCVIDPGNLEVVEHCWQEELGTEQEPDCLENSQ